MILFLTLSQPPKIYDTGPAHRLTLCESIDGMVYIMVEISPAIVDGASMEIVCRDIAFAYDQISATEPLPLYSDFISYLEDQSRHQSINWWMKYPANPQPCRFPLYGGDQFKRRQSCVASAEFEQASEIFAFSREHQVTLANILKVGWALVLRSYTGSNDGCFGYIASGRNVPVAHIDNLVGNTLSLQIARLVVEEQAQLIHLIGKMQNDYFEGLPHQHYPLVNIQRSLNQGEPLFNSMLSLEWVPREKYERTTVLLEAVGAPTDPIEVGARLKISSSG